MITIPREEIYGSLEFRKPWKLYQDVEQLHRNTLVVKKKYPLMMIIEDFMTPGETSYSYMVS